ncbi:kunitz-type serine protease inhibitor DrTI-like [Lotus japonicus]|uniref:kunitz-type serine protease inhibitor DrTI-like n=1 Tax=Lotus japonicus TaxID=34305 RepID=UPI002586CFB2|nr:kunitz-type serine protease inhibitor DrTI-like [Lotus japonicus]
MNTSVTFLSIIFVHFIKVQNGSFKRSLLLERTLSSHIHVIKWAQKVESLGILTLKSINLRRNNFLVTKSFSFLTIFFLLFAFTIKLKFATAGDSVKDKDGNILNVTSEYLMQSANNGDGITVTRVKGKLAVILSSNALPATFTDSSKSKVILIDDIVSINFTNITEYSGSSSWIVVYDESTKLSYIGVGSAKDYPGQQIKIGTFKIESIGAHYKLVFCSDNNKSSCKNVGVDGAEGIIRRLAINGSLLPIQFKKHNK